MGTPGGRSQTVATLLAGMMLGGGCGQELAHWIVHGRPEKDMYGYDIRQVHTSVCGMWCGGGNNQGNLERSLP